MSSNTTMNEPDKSSNQTSSISSQLSDNKQILNSMLPLGNSFDIMTRELIIGGHSSYWIGINGFCNTSILSEIFSDIQNPLYMDGYELTDIKAFIQKKIGYSQISLCSDMNEAIHQLLSGPSVLFIDGFSDAIIIDARNYPMRSVSEPDTEKVIKGAKDGFVETMVYNTAMIRRRIRNSHLTYKICRVGSDSATDVCIGYIDGKADENVVKAITDKLNSLSVTSLTMGAKSLEELIVKKSLLHPLPNLLMTERPDVCCSYLSEGYVILIVDNSPVVMILPCTIFQFTQSPEDYYKSPSVGNYLRFVRFFSILASLLILPLFLLLSAWFPDIPEQWRLVKGGVNNPFELLIYVLFIEIGLDLFKYASAHSSSGFSGSLAIVGGLIISDVAISLNWASMEVLFYGAATMLTTLSLPNIEFGEAIRMYRILLVILTGFLGIYGFIIGIILITISVITTPVFGGKSYFWPLYPFNWDALKTLIFRYPTAKAQPSTVWNKSNKHR